MSMFDKSGMYPPPNEIEDVLVRKQSKNDFVAIKAHALPIPFYAEKSWRFIPRYSVSQFEDTFDSSKIHEQQFIEIESKWTPDHSRWWWPAMVVLFSKRRNLFCNLLHFIIFDKEINSL